MTEYKYWRYALRAPTREECLDDDDFNWRRWEWAVVIMDSNGMFAAVSDYGEHINHWSHFSQDFRRFILGVYWDYFLGKTRGERKKELQVAKSKQNIRKDILDCRRRGELTKEQAKSEWELINDVDDQDEHGLRDWLDLTEYFNSDGCGYESFRYDYNEQDKMFVNRILPRLKAAKAAIRKQLQEEEEAATTTLLAARRELRRDRRVTTPVS